MPTNEATNSVRPVVQVPGEPDLPILPGGHGDPVGNAQRLLLVMGDVERGDAPSSRCRL